MAADDDCFMVIIKEEPEKSDNDTVEIKQEYLFTDESLEYLDEEELQDPSTIESLLELAALHGERIVIKEEPVKIEYLSDASSSWEPEKKRKRGRPTKNGSKRNGPRNLMTRKKVEEANNRYGDTSFVSQLRKSDPKLADDEEALVTELARKMIETRQPSPPPGAYVALDDQEYSCLECGDRRATEPAIRRHYQERHGARAFRCYSCAASFRNLMNLYRHERICHGADGDLVLQARARAVLKARPTRPYYDKAAVMRKAMRRVGKLKPLPAKHRPRRFACSECPAAYTNKSTLDAHASLHRGERQWVCVECGAAYYHRTSLLKHSAKHSGTKFICEQCGREFGHKYSIIAHLDTHRAVKKHACTYDGCERRFSTKLALRLHYDRTHLLLPPPCACQLCDRRFARMSLLKTHMKRAHGMDLMTRNMFFKTLPNLSDSQVQTAKVILKHTDPEAGVVLKEAREKATKAPKKAIKPEATLEATEATEATQEAIQAEEDMFNLEEQAL